METYLGNNIVYSWKWNFDLEFSIRKIANLNEVKKDQDYYKAIYNHQQLIKLEHRSKNRIFHPLIEYYDYHYTNHLLVKKEYKNRWGLIRWYCTYHYNDRNQIEKCVNHSLTPDEKDYYLENYSLFYYNNQGNRNLRKILDPKGNLQSYEVYHYDENNLLYKKEMFNRNNDKIFSEQFQYNLDQQLEYINYFDSEGNFDRAVQVFSK